MVVFIILLLIPILLDQILTISESIYGQCVPACRASYQYQTCSYITAQDSIAQHHQKHIVSHNATIYI